MIGRVVGSYRIVATIGRGSMGTVYRAEHTIVGHSAAIKMLTPQVSQDRDAVARFFREAKVLASVCHSGLPLIFDFGSAPGGDGPDYLIMEFLRGESLRARLIREGRFAQAQACAFTLQLAQVMAAVHEAGVVHRDLKPENIFLSPDDQIACGWRVRVLDFGVAKLRQEHGALQTAIGLALGTPTYMSPEQCGGASHVIDSRADVYALGCILFEMLLGRPPFQATTADELFRAHITRPAPDLREMDGSIPEWLNDLILRMLAKRPHERPARMEHVARSLQSNGEGGLGADPGRTVGIGVLAPAVAVPPAPVIAQTGAWRRVGVAVGTLSAVAATALVGGVFGYRAGRMHTGVTAAPATRGTSAASASGAASPSPSLSHGPELEPLEIHMQLQPGMQVAHTDPAAPAGAPSAETALPARPIRPTSRPVRPTTGAPARKSALAPTRASSSPADIPATRPLNPFER
jgi:serine/threonine-protein kinase